MKLQLYNEIIKEMNKLPSRDALTLLKSKYKDLSERTLRSIISQECQRKTKRLHVKHHSSEAMESYYAKYLQMCKNLQAPGCALQLADENDLAPSLMARILLEQHLSQHGEIVSCKQEISRLMKNTCLIEDKLLSIDVYLCILNDDQYGPLTDSVRHSIGQEYEFKLKQHLQKLHIPFVAEEQLRIQGYDKTPDVKLEIPFAVEGHVINWIESKASFGDEINHKIYLKDQFWSYWNRFGPGLVIYWFGYIDELDVNGDKGILLSDNFPSNITFMDPGNIA